MLAVKLHHDKKPNTRRGSYWIPLLDWHSGRLHIGQWRRMLNREKVKARKKVCYVTLAHIPADFPVFIGVDWTVRHCIGVAFRPLAQWEPEIKQALLPSPKAIKKDETWNLQHFMRSGPIQKGEPKAELPEMILGADLPSSAIKWTKDIKLLYGNGKGNLKTGES